MIVIPNKIACEILNPHLAVIPDAARLCPRLSGTEEPFQPGRVALAAGDLWTALRVFQTVVSVVQAAGAFRRDYNQAANFGKYLAALRAGGLNTARVGPRLANGEVPVQPGHEALVWLTLNGGTAGGVVGSDVSLLDCAAGSRGEQAARQQRHPVRVGAAGLGAAVFGPLLAHREPAVLGLGETPTGTPEGGAAVGVVGLRRPLHRLTVGERRNRHRARNTAH